MPSYRPPSPGHRVLSLAVVLSVPWVTLACDSEPTPEESVRASAPARASTPAEQEVADAVAAQARPVASVLMTTLSGRLQGAIQERGTAGALEFCNVEALPLTAQVAEEQGMEVTRTSLRVRNPANSADAADAEALAWFQDRLASGGEPPPSHVRAVEGGGYRYYQPLMTASLCVQCHGPREALAPDVLEALEERYPQDQAVGYAEGDWRGLLRVSVPESAVQGS